jgi:phenylacetyl-CoA:acceptor oxidoreductase subunit 2
VLALAYLVCQGRIVQAAKGIPAWREPLVVPLMMVTGLAEGAGVFWLAEALRGAAATALPWLAFGVLLALRVVLVSAWYRRLAPRLGRQALAAARATARIGNTGGALALVLVVAVAAVPAVWALALQALAGAVAAFAGVAFKWTLITRAAYNQGFAIAHLPVRGVPRQ